MNISEQLFDGTKVELVIIKYNSKEEYEAGMAFEKNTYDLGSVDPIDESGEKDDFK